MRFGLYPLALLLAAATTLMTGCMDRSLPPAPEGSGDLRDDFAAAIEAGDEARVNDLLATEPLLLNEPLPNSTQYPLHTAAGVGNAAMVRLLLDKGANPAVQNDEGDYPADTARISGASEEVVSMLQLN